MILRGLAALQATRVVAYLVSLAVTIPAAGWVGDRWGSQRTFLTALGLFAGASALCGLSTTLGQLVSARILQGAASGVLTPVGALIAFTLRDRDKEAATSMQSNATNADSALASMH